MELVEVNEALRAGSAPAAGRGWPPSSRRPMREVLIALSALSLISTVALPAARAADAPAPIGALLLELMAPRPIESRESALNQSLRDTLPAPRHSPLEGRGLPDGSVQYGEGRGAVLGSGRQVRARAGPRGR